VANFLSLAQGNLNFPINLMKAPTTAPLVSLFVATTVPIFIGCGFQIPLLAK